jgi:hypothetical protein
LNHRDQEAHTEERHSDPSGPRPRSSRPDANGDEAQTCEDEPQGSNPTGPELLLGFHEASLPTTRYVLCAMVPVPHSPGTRLRSSLEPAFLAAAFAQHADEHGPAASILLQVEQQFGKGPTEGFCSVGHATRATLDRLGTATLSRTRRLVLTSSGLRV